MAFVLNTNSGYLHLDDHGDGTEFARADAADLHARSLGMSMQFCKQCFGENRNTLEADRLRAMEEAIAEGEPRPHEETLAPSRVTTEAPAGTTPDDPTDGAPLTRVGRPTLPPTPPSPQTD